MTSRLWAFGFRLWGCGGREPRAVARSSREAATDRRFRPSTPQSPKPNAQSRAKSQSRAKAERLKPSILLFALACSGSPEVQTPAIDSAAAVDLAACGDSARIEGAGVGSIVRGMPAAAAREVCDGRDTTFSLGEGIQEQGVTVSLSSGGAILALVTGTDSVQRVFVTGPGPTTEQGIGVGSTIAEVREAYPDACVMAGEGRLVVIAPGTGVSFETTSPVTANPDIAALPDTTRISRVFVHGEEVGCL